MTTNRSPAAHLRYNDSYHGDIIMIDVKVPQEGFQDNTYYSCLNFNQGGSQDGGGYCGFVKKGKTIIFSMWDPHSSTSEKITTSFNGLWTTSHYFGHEGHGLHSENNSIGWRPDEWYTLAMRAWPEGNHTQFGLWIHNQTDNVWTHFATMDYPISGLVFATSTLSFIENPGQNSDGSLHREVFYGHGFKRRQDKTWFPFTQATFTVNDGDKTAHWNANFNGGSKGDYFFMETGKTVHPDAGVDRGDHFNLANPGPATPTDPPIAFTISRATYDVVEWSVPESSTPQFAYTISVDGTTVAAANDAEKKSFDLGHVRGQKVTVTLEDILGRKTSVSHDLA